MAAAKARAATRGLAGKRRAHVTLNLRDPQPTAVKLQPQARPATLCASPSSTTPAFDPLVPESAPRQPPAPPASLVPALRVGWAKDRLP
ncbi:hypothetical protein CCMA1212_004189 [Trichoderma ghanense]|uniref:Uncharacterized protein n=1 Tax=Trichoderma ghanense TaxID=65468 RepID=A0ABY2H6I2_9HYPO